VKDIQMSAVVTYESITDREALEKQERDQKEKKEEFKNTADNEISYDMQREMRFMQQDLETRKHEQEQKRKLRLYKKQDSLFH
jgi:hypothetical protein